MRSGWVLVLVLLSARAFAQSESPGDVLSQCIPLLRGEKVPVKDRLRAIERLKEIGNLAAEAGPELIPLLADDRLAIAAADAIHAMGPAEVEILLSGLRANSQLARERSARELLKTKVELSDIADRPAFIALIADANLDLSARLLGAAAADPDPETRDAALQAMAKSSDKELRWISDRVMSNGDIDTATALARFPEDGTSGAATTALRAWILRSANLEPRPPTAEEIAAAQEARQRKWAEMQEREILNRTIVAWAQLMDAVPQAIETLRELGMDGWLMIRYAPFHAKSAVETNLYRLERGGALARREALVGLSKLPAAAGPAYGAVVRCLHDQDFLIRHLAAHLLGTEEANQIVRRGDIVDTLRDETPANRSGAVELMKREGMIDAATEGVMKEAVASPEWIMRTGFVLAANRAWLTEKSLAAALDDLEKARLDDLDHLAVIAAKKMLEAGRASHLVVAPQRGEILLTLRKQMESDDPSAKRRALRFARQVGMVREIQASVEAAALSDDRELRGDATVALLSLGEEGVPGLVKMLERGDTGARGLALLQLATLGDKAASAGKPIRKACDDPDAQIAMLASSALRQIDPTHPDRVRQSELSPWLRLLRDQDRGNREAAAMRLHKEGVLEKQISEALIKAVMSGDFAAREGLALGIERAWKEEISVEEALKKISTEDDPTRRAYAKAGLRAIGSQTEKKD